MRPVLAVAAVLVALMSAPAAGDGKHVPDEPYRWSTGVAELVSPVYRDGSSPPLNAATPETGPQASVAVPQGALAVPAGARSVRVALTAVDVARPRSGPALSNGYALELRDDVGRVLTARPEKRPITVLLRSGTAPTADVVAELQTSDASSRVIETRQLHAGLYAVDVREPGVLVLVDRVSRVDAGTGAELPVGPAEAVSASALVLVGSVAALRRRNRAHTSHPDGGA